MVTQFFLLKEFDEECSQELSSRSAGKKKGVLGLNDPSLGRQVRNVRSQPNQVDTVKDHAGTIEGYVTFVILMPQNFSHFQQITEIRKRYLSKAIDFKYTNFVTSKHFKMAVRLCTRQPSHSNVPIFGICIEKDCEDNPLTCRLCIKKFHQGHMVVSLNHLEQSCEKTLIPPKLTALIRKFSLLGQQLQKQAQRSSNHVVEASSKIFENIYNQVPFTNILANPLKLAHIPELVKYISSSKQYCPRIVKSLIPLVRSFYFTGGYDLSPIQKEREQTAKELQELFLKAQSSIMTILKNLEQSISQYTRKNVEVNQTVVKQEEACSTFLKSSLDKQMVPQVNVKEEQESEKTEEEHHKSVLKRFNLARNSEKDGQIVVLRETRECQIDVVIHYIDVNKIRELTLSNNSYPIVVDSKGIDHIAKMTQLRVLRLFWAKDLKDLDACRMTKNMTELRQLCLGQFEDCSQILVNALKVNNPKLKKLVFSMDIHHLVRYTEENIEFIPDTAYQYQDEQTWISLTSGLNDLTNLELHHPENKSYWTNYIRQNGKKLREFTLSNIDQSKSGHRMIKQLSYTPLFKVMQICISLKCLRLQQIHFDDKILVKVIQKNPKLQTFMANQCSCISNKTYAFIAKTCTHMEEFSIQMDDNFNIETLVPMVSVKTLIIRGCWGFKEEKFIEVISRLTKIKCLSIDYNYEWVTEKTLRALGKLSDLKVLNINGNNLSTKDIQGLSAIPYLNTLICHNNCFKYTDITSLPLGKKLKKLSIGKIIDKGQNLETIDLRQIVEAFPSLSHLKLKGFKNIQSEFLGLLPRMICLTVVETEKEELVQAKRYCQQNEIYFNHDEL